MSYTYEDEKSWYYPTPTYYAGHWFRSRTEAKWAVFFSNIGIEWHYERTAYKTADDYYLPDFELVLGNSKRVLFEVKPTDYNEVDPRWKFTSRMTGYQLFVAYGFPDSTDPIGWSHPEAGNRGHVVPFYPSYDLFYAFCFCPWCKAIGIEYEGRAERICGSGAHDEGWSTYTLPDGSEQKFYKDKQRTHEHPEMFRAYAAASKYRFPRPALARTPKRLVR